MRSLKPEHALKKVLAKNVRNARNSLSWSQEKLAEATGLTQVYISQIESAKTSATVDTIEKLARGLSWLPSELLKQQ